MNCRHCGAKLSLPFMDLGVAPLSNAYLTPQTLHKPEMWFPLRVLVCAECWLVQTEDYAETEVLFSDEYAYFSSYSTTWLQHAKRYVTDMVERFHLNADSHIVEVAANDGYLLKYVKAKGIPCLGIEPTASTAAVAKNQGIEIVEDFFGSNLARDLVTQSKQADLVIANNVLAHVPDINDFVYGVTLLLKPEGVVTFEFPHLLQLVEENQFDTIYHEHFSYLSLTSVAQVLHHNGLLPFDVEELSTHGGSLRVFAQRKESGVNEITSRFNGLLAKENRAGMRGPAFYKDFQKRADRVKYDFLTFLINAKRNEKTVAAYGAAAKGNTLLNYAGIRPDLVPYVVDCNPYKQGKVLPGSHIPIVTEKRIRDERPDYVVILPWNLREEVVAQLDYIREWGGVFVTAIPFLKLA